MKLTSTEPVCSQQFNVALTPGPEVECLEGPGNWRSLGSDPWFVIHEPCSGGWVQVRTDLRTGPWDQPKLYADIGLGFSEAQSWRLPVYPGEPLRTLVRLPSELQGLRFDPMERPGTFTLKRLSIRPVRPWRVAWHFLWPVLQTLPRRPGILLGFLKTVRRTGYRSLLRRLRVFRSCWEAERHSYADWISAFDTLSDEDRAAIRERAAALVPPPQISVVLTGEGWNTGAAEGSLDSVRRQLYPAKEVLIAAWNATGRSRPVPDRGSPQDEGPPVRVVSDSAGRDYNPAHAINGALEAAGGDWVAFMRAGDRLAEHALFLVALEAVHRPQAVLLYGDDDWLDASGARRAPYFKPDWNPDLCLATNYLDGLTVLRTAAVREVGGLRPEYHSAALLDSLLRLTERAPAENICHIPHVLCHRGSDRHRPPTDHAADSEHEIQAVQDHLDRVCPGARCLPADGARWRRIVFPLHEDHPLVSVILLTRNGGRMLKHAVDGVRSASYKPVQILVVDNGSDDPATLAYLAALGRSGATVIAHPAPFNYSAMNNRAAARAQGEILLFLNDDVEPMDDYWLAELVRHALRPEVGAVGAALYYADDSLQHGGVILGAGSLCDHAHQRLPLGESGYHGRAVITQDVSAVTGACFGMRASVFQTVGGFDPELSVSYNDIDICLRLRRRGYQIVWTPLARLYHREAATRGWDDTRTKLQRFQREHTIMWSRWGDIIRRDPSYNPQLSSDGLFCLAWPPSHP